MKSLNILFLTTVGLLKVGVPQPWEKSKKNLTYVRKAGVRQFVSQYEKVKDLQGDELLWGDEIEYGIFHVDKDKKEIRLSLRAKEVRIHSLTLDMFFCKYLIRYEVLQFSFISNHIGNDYDINEYQ